MSGWNWEKTQYFCMKLGNKLLRTSDSILVLPWSGRNLKHLAGSGSLTWASLSIEDIKYSRLLQNKQARRQRRVLERESLSKIKVMVFCNLAIRDIPCFPIFCSLKVTSPLPTVNDYPRAWLLGGGKPYQNLPAILLLPQMMTVLTMDKVLGSLKYSRRYSVNTCWMIKMNEKDKMLLSFFTESVIIFLCSQYFQMCLTISVIIQTSQKLIF